MTHPAKGSRPRSDSIIGTRMRIDGNVDFAGTVRIHGSVHGDVIGADDPEAKAVVAESGSVVGTVRAAHIIVQGRADGPLVSDRTIDIFPSGRCTGGAQYNALSVQEGGVIDGVLQLASSIEVARPRRSPRIVAARPVPDSGDVAILVNHEAKAEAPGNLPALRPALTAETARPRRLGLWVGAALVVIAILWAALPGPKAPVLNGSSPAPAPAAAAATTSAGTQTVPEPVPSPSSSVPQAPTPAAAKPLTPAIVTPRAETPVTAGPTTRPPQSTAARSGDDAGRVAAVEGANADKPANLFFIVTREATVIHRKKRSDAGEGMRIEIARGRNLSLQVARDEVVRIASGHDIDVFFQGRKVLPATVEAGTWISFVPASRQAPATTPAPAASAAPATPAGDSPPPGQ